MVCNVYSIGMQRDDSVLPSYLKDALALLLEQQPRDPAAFLAT